MKKFILFFLTLFLLRPLSAEASSVTFQSKENGFSFAPGSSYSPTDLFPGFKDILPGDRLTDTVVLKNTSNIPLQVTFQALGGEEDTALLSNLSLEVTAARQVVFDDTADKASDPAVLGILQPGSSLVLELMLEVPLTLGDEFQKARGDVLWVFRAEEVPDTLTQTGQSLDLILWCGLFGGCALLTGMLLWRKKDG